MTSHRLDALRGHSLMPPASQVAKIPRLYETEATATEDKIVVLHYFVGAANWWIVELDPDQRLAFGYVNLGDDRSAEWGYVDLDELSDVCVHDGLILVERDLHWKPKRFGEITTKRT